jgi:hypothetical protein
MWPGPWQLALGLQCHLYSNIDIWLPNLVQRPKETHQVIASCPKHGNSCHCRSLLEHSYGALTPANLHPTHTDPPLMTDSTGGHMPPHTPNILSSPTEAGNSLVFWGREWNSPPIPHSNTTTGHLHPEAEPLGPVRQPSSQQDPSTPQPAPMEMTQPAPPSSHNHP